MSQFNIRFLLVASTVCGALMLPVAAQAKPMHHKPYVHHKMMHKAMVHRTMMHKRIMHKKMVHHMAKKK